MRKLKIRQSVKRRAQLLPIKEYLTGENFCLDEFMDMVSRMEKMIHEHEADFDETRLIEYYQELETNYVYSISHLRGRSYADVIADARENGEEILKLRWLNAHRVAAMAQEFQTSGVPVQELLLAGMQGVKNAALTYDFNPHKCFDDFAAPIIRRHMEQYILTGELPFAQPDNEYEAQHAKVLEAYHDYCSVNSHLRQFARFHSPKQRENLFAAAKINRCRKELIETAELVERKMVSMAVHLPDDYDESDKYIRTPSYTVQDAVYCGECKDLVKTTVGEWCLCTVPEGRHIAVSTVTDRESLHRAMNALMEIAANLIKLEVMPLRHWRARL